MDYSRLDRVCTYIFHPVPPFPWRPGLNDRVGHELWTLIQYINSTNRFLSLYRVDDSGIKLLLEHVITVPPPFSSIRIIALLRRIVVPLIIGQAD